MVATPFAVLYSEPDIRRLCGDLVFARADALEHGGHVIDPLCDGPSLRATVRGTWRRVDRVAVSGQGNGLAAECTCGAGGFCRHAGALALHWLRARSSFTEVDRQEAAPGPLEGRWDETPVAELARWLGFDVMAHLREMARRRGASANGRNKPETIARLAESLAGAESVDTALAGLGHEERLALDAAQLLDGGAGAREETITAAYRALGGIAEDAPVGSLADLGLLVTSFDRFVEMTRYHVPRAVEARLPLLDVRIPRAPSGSGGGPDAGPAPGIWELLYLVARECADDTVRRQAEQRPSMGNVPAGWQRSGTEHVGEGTETRIVPSPSPLAVKDLRRVAARLGQPPAAVAFAARLLLELRVLEGAGRLRLSEGRLQALFAMVPEGRLGALARAWLGARDWTELALVFGEEGPLRLYNKQYWYYPGSPFLLNEAARVRSLVAHLVGRLPPGVWYDFSAFAERLQGLASIGVLPPFPRNWRIAGHDGATGERPTPVAEDALLLASLAGAVLAGPLTWLGLVYVRGKDWRPLAFQVRPEAAVLVGRDWVDRPAASPRLVVGEDGNVLVPAGTADVSLLTFLGQAGELVGASAAGITYHLTARGMQGLFDAGITGPEVQRLLVERAGTPLPATVAAAIDRWWAGYGTVRLYDEITVIELGDDFVLPELLATSSLGSCLLHVFSPRLIAVEQAAVADLVAELTRLGHAPRIVDSAEGS